MTLSLKGKCSLLNIISRLTLKIYMSHIWLWCLYKMSKNVHKCTEYFSPSLIYPSHFTLAITPNFLCLFRHILTSSTLFFIKPPQFIFCESFSILPLFIDQKIWWHLIPTQNLSRHPWVPYSFLGWPETTPIRCMLLGLWTKSEWDKKLRHREGGNPTDTAVAAETTHGLGCASCGLQHFLIPDFLWSFLFPAVFFLFPWIPEVYKAQCDCS